ncbi:hypothetical protein AB6A40_008514 [Gnathostoma spinigerum]|uniref:Uncharacterized protein n=1 Tax=Gnathostoma spinigerum TaxID=75299 RepID=A0ABD6EQJ3_9BILA
MNVMTDYVLYRLLFETQKQKRRQSAIPYTVRRQSSACAYETAATEPFCSPVAPHIPIRERLANRRCASGKCKVFLLFSG